MLMTESSSPRVHSPFAFCTSISDQLAQGHMIPTISMLCIVSLFIFLFIVQKIGLPCHRYGIGELLLLVTTLIFSQSLSIAPMFEAYLPFSCSKNSSLASAWLDLCHGTSLGQGIREWIVDSGRSLHTSKRSVWWTIYNYEDTTHRYLVREVRRHLSR